MGVGGGQKAEEDKEVGLELTQRTQRSQRENRRKGGEKRPRPGLYQVLSGPALILYQI